MCRLHFLFVFFVTLAIQLSDRVWAVEVWTPWEASLTSTRSYANPYANVTVSVAYTAPNGTRTTGNAFWDGGSTFRVRFMFPESGIWSWRTASSDTYNKGLHNRTGTVTVTPYTGANTLYSRGYPKVSGNARYLTYGNGVPFLWLGDTAWAAPIAATQAEWEAYINQRRDQKFNVIQVHTGRGWLSRTKDRSGNAPFLGSGSSLRWNPAYWQGVDQKVRYANSQGLFVFFTAISTPGSGFPTTNTTEVRRFARNFAARMNGYFVVYSPVADGFPTSPADACGNELAARAPRHLVTAHPRFELSPAQTFHDRSYTDFAGLQSGNGWPEPFSALAASQNAIDWTLALYEQMPLKPVINMEVVYDSMRLQSGDTVRYLQPYPTRMPRSAAYLAILSGSQGVTYGAGGVWNWGNPVGNASAGWSLETALNQPSATQMQYAFDLFSGLEWWSLVPSHQYIQDQSADPLRRMVFARSADGRLGVAYLPDNGQITLDMTAFAGLVIARWFNPVTNLWDEPPAEPEPVANNGTYTFLKPTEWADAVLVLTVPEGVSGAEIRCGSLGISASRNGR